MRRRDRSLQHRVHQEAPNDAQFVIEVTAVVGGLVLCLIAVVLSRLKSLDRKLDAFRRERDAGER